jgi:hypothetical protein
VVKLVIKRKISIFYSPIKREKAVKKANPHHDRLGRFADAPDGGGAREPWHTSTDKAKELKAEDRGTPEEIAEMARMERNAKNRDEAIKILEKIRKEGLLYNKNNKKLPVSISRETIKKMVNDTALYTSFDRAAHWKAVANIDKLYENAIEPWKFELNPEKNNQDIKERHIFYSPMDYLDKIVPVKITVKEYKDDSRGTRLYSVEAVDVILQTKKIRGAGQQRDGVIEKSTSLSLPAWRPYIPNIAHVFDSVNEYLEKRRSKYG